jgi:hypothetical protein
MASHEEIPYEPRGLNWRDWLEKADPFFYWVFRVGAVVSLLSLAYILFALFSGAATQAPTADPRAIQVAAQLANDMRVAVTAFHWAILATAVSALILALDVRWMGPVLAGVGFLLHFGAPLALKAMGQTASTAVIAQVLRGTGMALLVIGLLKYSVDLFMWLQELPGRMKARADVGSPQKAEAAQQRVARYANMFSPCWQLPFCREVIRKQCPAFLARKRCWKFGRGCYCDEEMISRIIRGEPMESIKAPTRMSGKKPPCGRCHIFLEHQSLKYKVMAPLAVPASIGLMFVSWPVYETVFRAVFGRMDALWSRISFDPRALTPESVRTNTETSGAPDAVSALGAEMTPDKMQSYALWMFGILLGFFLLIYLSKFIEWAILKAKL